MLGSNPYVCRSYSRETGAFLPGGGAEFIQNFHKREIDIPYRGKFRREKFSLEKIFVTYPKFHHFSPTKNFSSDIINIIDLR